MANFLEAKLKDEYGADSPRVWQTLNSLGWYHGNKETPKGKAAQRKHEADLKARGQLRGLHTLKK